MGEAGQYRCELFFVHLQPLKRVAWEDNVNYSIEQRRNMLAASLLLVGIDMYITMDITRIAFNNETRISIQIETN